MKCRIFLIIAVLSSLLVGCGLAEIEKRTQFEFTFINNSGSDLSLQGYYGGNEGDVFELPSNDTLVQEFLSGGSSIIPLADSVQIIINNEETIIYRKSDASPYNILDWDNYEYEVVDKVQKFTYTFSPDDFQ